MLLDEWEQRIVYDQELASVLGCSPGRAGEIRLAHDAQWQTLNPQAIAQAKITPAEIQGFNSFHASRTNLYSCVLPGEVIFKCVDALRQGSLQPASLPAITHLIVDEYQDLNACDQEYIRLLCQGQTVLFIAGDDDQSIYSFRHANPDGIVSFHATYPNSKTHVLTDCFRCTPAVLSAAGRLIQHNPTRIAKTMVPLYANASPPVQGRVQVWQLPSPQQEAQFIALSCRELIHAGMANREDEILVLVCNRKLQLDLITKALRDNSVPFEPPKALSFVDEYEAVRAVYSILRILRDQKSGEEDYPAYRDLLGLLSGVGQKTAKDIGDACITNNQNFRDMFYLPAPPAWLASRGSTAVNRVIQVCSAVGGWTMEDSVSARAKDIETLLTAQVFISGAKATANVGVWTSLAGFLPGDMTLDELCLFLGASNESEQEAILKAVAERVAGSSPAPSPTPAPKKVRILTMHGAKGLSGSIVFIPAAEQGIIPNFKALKATGLLIEQRRLFYVSATRTKASCIITHNGTRTGFQAQAVANKPFLRLGRSQFLNEMSVPTVQRSGPLTAAEAQSIVAEINNL
jgi:DNA helicase-2/ATP-dependent DNA helicase PcrA